MKFRVFRLHKALLPCLLAAVFLALALALHFTGAYAVYTGGTVRKLHIYSVEREDKKIAISFDCAWGVDYTQEILDVLAREDVRATFFMVEFWAEKYPEYVKKIDAAGHEIGTHSATHSQMSKLSEGEIRQELASSSEAIASVTGKAVELFRPPFGEYDDLLIRTAREAGLYTVQWDVDSLDWKGLSAPEIAQRVLTRVQSGSIILCHNNGEHTAEALPAVLSALKTRGYTFVPVGELIYRGNFRMAADGRQYAG